MSTEKKAILVFTSCDGSALRAAETPALKKLHDKGVVFTNVKASGDSKAMAGAGAAAGQTLWDAASAQKLVVKGLHEGFDLCVLDAGATVTEVESLMTEVMEVTNRMMLIVLVGKDTVVFHGTGIAKGKVVDKELCVCSVAPTVAYVINFPVPEQCEAPIAYAALKDINAKFNEIKKLQETILGMEAAVERNSRQPWDKHDCA